MEQVTVHASTIAFEQAGRARAVILGGRSGSGKSTLALELMALGARLVSDDQTRLRLTDGVLVASAPETLKGMIEWRGVGLMPAHPVCQAQAVVWVDLDHPSDTRLPEPEWTVVLGVHLPRLRPPRNGPIAAALCSYMHAQAWLLHGETTT